MLQRLNFSGLELLVNRILDSLPDRVWEDPTVRFLDPDVGCGRGIFVRVVEERLRKYGHSDENISARVYGYTSEPIIKNFLVTRYSLVGNYEVKNVLEEEIDMKFDVILGNPPYNEATTSEHASSMKKGRANLSIQFIEKGLSALKENGIIAYVTPDHWLRPTSRVRDTLKKDGHFVHANLSSDDIKKEHFPGVGSTFTWWVWAKNKGKNNFICEGKKLPENILDCKMYANTGKYDDWQFVLGRKGICFDWKRTKNNSSVLVPKKTVLMPLSSTNKLAIYDGENMPVNKDFYYHVFDSNMQAQKVVDFFLSEEGKRLVKVNKSGPALTKEILDNMPIEIK